HHRRRRGGRQEGDPHEGAGRPLVALPPCGRAARRTGNARAVHARADRAARRAAAAPSSRCPARRRPSGAVSGRTWLPLARPPRRRPDPFHREVRLPRVRNAPDGLGACARKVRTARRSTRGARARGRAGGDRSIARGARHARPDSPARARGRARDHERSSPMTTTTEARTETEQRAFAFLRQNERPPKPRKRGVTEIRGPYYAPVGRRYLEDLLETMGAYVDALKYAGGSFALMPRETVRALNELCHQQEVEVSTGGFLEYVLTQRGDAVARYLDECQELGFDIVEISSGFVTLPVDDLVRLTSAVGKAGLKAKPEVGIQFGAGGA